MKKGGQIFYRWSLFVYIEDHRVSLSHLISHNSKNLQFDHDVPTLTAADAAIHRPTTPLTEENSRLRPNQSSAPIASIVQMTPLAATASIAQDGVGPNPPSLLCCSFYNTSTPPPPPHNSSRLYNYNRKYERQRVRYAWSHAHYFISLFASNYILCGTAFVGSSPTAATKSASQPL
jgi:hypothetical protein